MLTGLIIKYGVAAVIGLLGLIGAGVAAVFEHGRRTRARAYLAKLDAGEVCIRCDGIDVLREADKIVCQACGFAASHARLVAATISAAQLKAVTTQSTDSTFFGALQPNAGHDPKDSSDEHRSPFR